MILLTADMHIRADVPKCRTDDFLVAQWDKLHQIDQIIRQHNIEYWLDAGDIFEKAKPSLELVIKTMQHWPRLRCHAVAGNHDMPSHNFQRINESGFGVLLQAGRVEQLDGLNLVISRDNVEVHIYGASYKQPIPEPEHKSSKRIRNVLILHDMIYKSRRDTLPNAPGTIASALLRRLGYDLISSGHNHAQFDHKHEDKLLVNMGCLSRQAADLTEFKPRVAVYNPYENTVEYIYLKCDHNVVTREHIVKEQQKEDQISAFVEMLQDDESNVELTFEGNVNAVIAQTQPEKRTQDKIWEAVG